MANPNLGSFGSVLLKRASGIIPTAASAVLRKTGDSGFAPKIVYAETQAALSSIFERPGDIAATDVAFGIDFEPTAADLLFIVEHMLGAAVTTNFVTPVNNDVGTYQPLPNLDVEIVPPGEAKTFGGVQITSLELTWNARGYMGAKIDCLGLTQSDLGSPTSITVPANPFLAPHCTLTRAGSNFLVDAMTMRLEVPLKKQEGTTGSTSAVGFVRSGMVKLTVDATIPTGSDSGTKSAFEQGTLAALTVDLVRGSNIFRADIPSFQVLTREPVGGNAERKIRMAGKAVISAQAYPFRFSNV